MRRTASMTAALVILVSLGLGDAAVAGGVTDDEITIVLYNGVGVEGEMNEPWQPSDERRLGATDYQTANIYRTIKAYVRYLHQTTDTHGRTVRVVAAPEWHSTSCSSQAAQAQSLVDEFDPFAVVMFATWTTPGCFTPRLAELGVMSFAVNNYTPRAEYEAAQPFAWGYAPDLDRQSSLMSSMVCSSLAGRSARFSTDPSIASQTRTFGFIVPRNSMRGEHFRQQARSVANVVSTCADTVVAEYDASTALAGVPEARGIMTSFKEQGVTTVLCYCIPVPTESTVTTMQNAATGLAYFPEWVWDPTTAMDVTLWHAMFANKAQTSLGMSWRSRQTSPPEFLAAYQQVEPGSTPNLRFAWEIFTGLGLAFQGIELAGPTVNVSTVHAGLSTVASRDHSDPFVAAGGFDDAESPFSFVDTAIGWWWDPTGTPVDGRVGEGCTRLGNSGVRYDETSWPANDSWLFTAAAPCVRLEPYRGPADL